MKGEAERKSGENRLRSVKRGEKTIGIQGRGRLGNDKLTWRLGGGGAENNGKELKGKERTKSTAGKFPEKKGDAIVKVEVHAGFPQTRRRGSGGREDSRHSRQDGPRIMPTQNKKGFSEKGIKSERSKCLMYVGWTAPPEQGKGKRKVGTSTRERTVPHHGDSPGQKHFRPCGPRPK